MFLRDVSYAHQGCIYVIKNTVNTMKNFGAQETFIIISVENSYAS